MYSFKKCIEVDDNLTYQAFTAGFSDYIVQVSMSQEQLMNRFFGIEGNDRKLSYVAFEDDKPIGVIFGGIKSDEVLKTLRCGAMCLIPEARGKGVANKMFELHENMAKEINCSQLFLEVIDSNSRAINFYERMGYEKVYRLIYMNWDSSKKGISFNNNKISNKIYDLNYDQFCEIKKVDFTHLPWQSGFEFFKYIDCNYYGIKDRNKLVAGLVGTNNRIFYIWVHPKYRLRGYAKAMLNKLIKDTNGVKFDLVYTNNSELHTFAKHFDMDKNKLGQFEMYKLLS